MQYEFPNIMVAVLRRLYLLFSDAFWRGANAINLLISGVKCGKGVRVRGFCLFLARKREDLVLGDRVVIESRFMVNPVGLLGPASLHTLYGGHIEIGSDTRLSSPIMSSRSSIKIGERCRFGGNVRIFDHDFHSPDPAIRSTDEDCKNVRTKPIVIGDDVFVGTNSIILKGTRIGERSIIAAGSVVFGLDIPPDSLVKGNPATIIVRAGNK